MRDAMKLSRTISRLRRHESGATAVEFAMVAGIFFMLMFGIIEYGLIMLSKVAIESAVMQVSRATSIGTDSYAGCSDRVCAIKKLVSEKTLGLVKSESVQVTANVVASPSAGTPPVPDICLNQSNDPYPATCPSGSGYINNDGTPGYQYNGGIDATSIGKGGDLVEIRVTYLWRVLFPMFEMFQSYEGSGGSKGYVVITSSAVIKNEPF
jgi:Flp pilus assembly protein TadG